LKRNHGGKVRNVMAWNIGACSRIVVLSSGTIVAVLFCGFVVLWTKLNVMIVKHFLGSILC
jgi:hypothetical protein